MAPAFLTRLSYRNTFVLMSQARQIDDNFAFAVLMCFSFNLFWALLDVDRSYADP